MTEKLLAHSEHKSGFGPTDKTDLTSINYDLHLFAKIWTLAVLDQYLLVKHQRNGSNLTAYLSLQNLAAAVSIIQLCLHVCAVLLVLKLQGLQPLLQLLLGYLQGFDISAQLRVLGTQTTKDKITQESAGEGSDGEACGAQ